MLQLPLLYILASNLAHTSEIGNYLKEITQLFYSVREMLSTIFRSSSTLKKENPMKCS